MSQYMQTTKRSIFTVLLVLLPFHAVLTVMIRYGFGVESGLIPFWKEFLLCLIGIFIGYEWWMKRSFPKFEMVDFVIFGYIIFGLAHALFFADVGLKQMIYGARYDFIFLVAYLLAKYGGLKLDDVRNLLKISLYAGLVAVVLGLVVHFVINPSNLVLIGFRDDWSTWYPGQSLAFCQKIEAMDVCRLSGTFAGPNQYAAYLVGLIGLALTTYRMKLISVKLCAVTILLAVVSMYFTYSRAGYIGTSVLFFICGSQYMKYISRKWIYGGVIFGGLVILTAFYVLWDRLLDLFLRPESSLGHLNAWMIGIREIVAHPFGLGLGTAGPASYHFGSPIIPENWYLQIGVEMGLIGMLLFLWILLLLGRHLWGTKIASGLLAALCSICIMALFLHTFEDAPTVISLFVIFGLLHCMKGDSEIHLCRGGR